MKVIMHMGLVFDKSSTEKIRKLFTKQIDTSTPPIHGALIIDEAFERPLRPIEYSVNMEEDYYHIQFKDFAVSNQGEYSQFVNRFKKHHWHEMQTPG